MPVDAREASVRRRTGSQRSGLGSRLPPPHRLKKHLRRTARIGSQHGNVRTHRGHCKLGIDTNPRLRLTVTSAEPTLVSWSAGPTASIRRPRQDSAGKSETPRPQRTVAPRARSRTGGHKQVDDRQSREPASSPDEKSRSARCFHGAPRRSRFRPPRSPAVHAFMVTQPGLVRHLHMEISLPRPPFGAT